MTGASLKTRLFLIVFWDDASIQIGAMVLPGLRIEDAQTLAPTYQPPGASGCSIFEIEPLASPVEMALRMEPIPNPLPQPEGPGPSGNPVT